MTSLRTHVRQDREEEEEEEEEEEAPYPEGLVVVRCLCDFGQAVYC
jgi:hypothetical protein